MLSYRPLSGFAYKGGKEFHEGTAVISYDKNEVEKRRFKFSTRFIF